jgi:hypothetical protein
MKSWVVVGSLLMVSLPVAARNPDADALRQQLKVQELIRQNELDELTRHQATLQEAWVRIDRELADHIRAQQQGESLESIQLRDDDLRLAEAEMMMHLLESQRLRRSLMDSQALIAATEDEIRRLETVVGPDEDPLTGNWRVVVEPGGQEGFLSLELDGTLVQGTYRLDGGWTGSLRGTLIAGKVRLERIDSQMGFVAIFYGRLQVSGGRSRLQGNWEATQLASGLPSAGSWVAERVEELPD